MRSALSFRSYSFVIFAFCLLFLIFGYRRLRSGKGGKDDDDYGERGSDVYSKLIQAKCADQSQIGEHSVCGAPNLNKERNCLVYSVAAKTDLKFEMDLSRMLDKCCSKCKMRVYDHEAKATESDGKYQVIEKVEAEAIDETVLKSVINPEKVKRKIHLLRLEAGDHGAELAQSSLLKDHSVCQLLLTLYDTTASELADFVAKMKKSYGYNLLAVNELEMEGEDQQQKEEEEEEEEEDEEEEEEKEGDKKKKEEKESKKDEKKKKRKEAKRNFTLSFIAQHCQKAYAAKD